MSSNLYTMINNLQTRLEQRTSDFNTLNTFKEFKSNNVSYNLGPSPNQPVMISTNQSNQIDLHALSSPSFSSATNEFYIRKLIKEEFQNWIMPHQQDWYNNVTVLENKIKLAQDTITSTNIKHSFIRSGAQIGDFNEYVPREDFESRLKEMESAINKVSMNHIYTSSNTDVQEGKYISTTDFITKMNGVNSRWELLESKIINISNEYNEKIQNLNGIVSSLSEEVIRISTQKGSGSNDNDINAHELTNLVNKSNLQDTQISTLQKEITELAMKQNENVIRYMTSNQQPNNSFNSSNVNKDLSHNEDVESHLKALKKETLDTISLKEDELKQLIQSTKSTLENLMQIKEEESWIMIENLKASIMEAVNDKYEQKLSDCENQVFILDSIQKEFSSTYTTKKNLDDWKKEWMTKIDGDYKKSISISNEIQQKNNALNSPFEREKPPSPRQSESNNIKNSTNDIKEIPEIFNMTSNGSDNGKPSLVDTEPKKEENKKNLDWEDNFDEFDVETIEDLIIETKK